MIKKLAAAALTAALLSACGSGSAKVAVHTTTPTATHYTFRSSLIALYDSFLPPSGWPSGGFRKAANRWDNYADNVALTPAPADERDIKQQLITACRTTAKDFRTADRHIFTGVDTTALTDDIAAVKRILRNLPR